MIRILKGSAVVGAVLSVIGRFVTSYRSSVFKRFVDAICLMCRESFVGRLVHRYIYKSPFYEHSLIYRVIMAVVGVFDRLFAWLNRCFKALLSGSLVVGALNSSLSKGIAARCFTAGVLVMSMCIGSTLAMLVTGVASKLTLGLSCGIFAVGCVVSLLSLCPKAVEDCFVVRGVKWLINELN